MIKEYGIDGARFVTGKDGNHIRGKSASYIRSLSLLNSISESAGNSSQKLTYTFQISLVNF
jgi:hypothetical protein